MRDARSADLPFIKLMLYEAANRPGEAWPSFEESMEELRNRRFWFNFARDGDIGVVAETAHEPIGAAWIRRFGGEEKGPLDDPDVPVLAIGVVEQWRGRGVGTLLMRSLLDRARRSGVAAIDLTTGAFNEAGVRLYYASGFVDTGRFGDAIRMRARLATLMPATTRPRYRWRARPGRSWR